MRTLRSYPDSEASLNLLCAATGSCVIQYHVDLVTHFIDEGAGHCCGAGQLVID